MADKKISELTELTTPDGTEELVVNDSGVSKKVQIDNLIADNGLSGNKIDGGTISNFTSTGIDDNATSTAITIDANENVICAGNISSNVGGSASAPRIYLSNTANTGIYTPVTNGWGVTTNGVSALVIDASQKVGIGTSSPSTKLELYGAAANDGPVIRLTGNGFNAAGNLLGGIEFVNIDSSGAGPNTVTNIKTLSKSSTGAGGDLVFGTHSGSGSEGSQPIERMRIDGIGNVGIGVVPETDWNTAWVALQVGSGAIANTISGTQTALAHNAKFTTTSSFSGNKYIKTEQASSYVQANGTHAFRVAPSGTANTAITWTDAITIDNSGDVTLPAGNLVIGTSGKGIDFSATSDGSGTMTSEVLDDYEEGTWTPDFSGWTTSPTAYGYYATYTKIGRMVTVYMRGYGGTNPASLQMGGLPFAPRGTPESAGICLSMHDATLGFYGVPHTNSKIKITSNAASYWWAFSASYETA